MQRFSMSWAVVATAMSAAVLVTASISDAARSEPAGPARATANGTVLAGEVLAARLATAKYATNLTLAKAAGYRVITPMIPNMGYHFMNPKVTGFDVRRPPILVYEHHEGRWQLGALEWVFTSKPATPPLPGAQYGSFGAACHYTDGTFVFAAAQASCAAKNPKTGAAFSFWHPRLVTLHLWAWYPNPAGLYMGMNPLVSLFNQG
jgi:hypothetical protein